MGEEEESSFEAEEGSKEMKFTDHVNSIHEDMVWKAKVKIVEDIVNMIPYMKTKKELEMYLIRLHKTLKGGK